MSRIDRMAQGAAERAEAEFELQSQRHDRDVEQAMQDGPDVVVNGGGTMYNVTPMTEAGRDWINKNVPETNKGFGRFSLSVCG